MGAQVLGHCGGTRLRGADCDEGWQYGPPSASLPVPSSLVKNVTVRVHNFAAGPCTLPLSVLEEARDELVDYQGTGMSLLEMSHRSPIYEEVHRGALALAAELYAMPPDFQVLFLQGGASLQFAMAPLNLLSAGSRAGYVVSGSWGAKAFADASHHGEAYAAWDGAPGYHRMPDHAEIEVQAGTRYLHVTSNETINGTEMWRWPSAGVPLVADMSSDLMSRRLPWERFDLIYGGVQKTLGPAGLTLVFVRRAVLAEARTDLGAYLRYASHAAKDSLYNTPPVFAVWMMGKVLEWIEARGGLPAMEKAAAHKAALLFRVIDEGFYSSPVEPASRSHMNVVFRLPSEQLEADFLRQAKAADLYNLKGHRSVGGIRASVYNAMPKAGVEALAQFMTAFRADRG